MPTFHFQLLDHEGVQPTGMSYEFDSEEAAIVEARTALAEMAADGLPVEIFDEQRKPIREIRLILEEIDKSSTA
ncbi:hypothetical protein AB9E06_34345 [Rhizobium leguminosarum]|uniref:DUF6894 family protein n=1 Tax=Rhizobium leguminosarum TaxID=384 RepID=UPI001C923CDD|nr:hypothetical protein [Rhizobium leguminosarum]MBY3043722.1 hypothetical protein [Rhizobium leguminosarum]